MATVDGLEIPEFQIARLAMKPGDHLIVKFNGRLDIEAAKALGAHFRANLEMPEGSKILLIDDQLDLQVLTRE